MFKRHNTIRAFCCAAIALFLATGVEGLKQVVFNNLSTWSAHIGAILLCASIVFVLSVGLLSREKPQQGTFFENTLRIFPEIVCIIDGAGRFRQWNLNFEKVLGYTAQEIAELTVRDTIAEDQRETVEQTTATVLTDGIAKKVESVLMCKDGTPIPCLLTGVRVVLNDQPCLLGIAVDLRKLRQTEENLRASGEAYRSLIESIPEVVWQSDTVGNVRFVSPRIETILGYSPAEVYQLGDSVWYDSIHVDDRQRVKQGFESLLNEGKPYDVEYRVQQKGGEWRWVHDRAFTTGERNNVCLVTGLLSDITERRASEEVNRRLVSIVEFSEDAITTVNTDGVITSWNLGAEQMYGYTKAEATGRDLSLIVPPDRQAEIRAEIQWVLSGRPMKAFETQRLTKAGHLLDVSLSVTPIKDADGRIAGAAAIARDITLRKRSDEQLSLQSAALESAANGIVITDGQGTIVWVNRAVTDMTGYSKQELLGKNPRVLKSGDQPEDYYADLWATISSGKVWRGEIVNRRKDGTTYTEEMTITPVTLVGTPVKKYFIAIKQDISERKQAQESLRLEAMAREQAQSDLRQSEERMRMAMKAAKIGFWDVDVAKDEHVWSDTCKALLGVPPDTQASYQALKGVVHPDDWKMMQAKIDRAIQEKLDYVVEFRVVWPDNSVHWRTSSGQAFYDDTGQVTRMSGITMDIHERRHAEERVQFLAYYDALTELPNRALLHDRLAKALASARRQKNKVALLFLDLDRFKIINDSLGHSLGDLLLQEVAKRLTKCAREQDTVARLGGDEFLIVVTSVKDIADAAVVAERYMDVLAAEFVVQGHSLSISCSVGISIFPEHGADSETLIKNADAAMYCAKDSGRNNFRFFTGGMNVQAVERLTLENSLRLALDNKELFLVYQPQIDIATGRITGLEALLRWQHPELGLVPPDKFIRIAENSGLIMPIGEWVLRTACSQARKWQDEGLLAVPVAVNVSAVQFRQEGFRKLIDRVLRDTGLAPQYLELELTESLLLSNADVMFSVLQGLRAMGLKLAIDDFGTGYSSLSYLKHFPISKLKIDRSFVRDVAVNPDDAAITTAIIGMAKSLHLKVIAEGVETEAQMSFLRAHKCDEIQGYYFSKPLAVDKVADKLRGDCHEAHVRAQASGGQS